MLKVLAFFKKRPGMTTEQFKKQYETGYAPTAKPYVREAKRYFRRYVEPGSKLDFDVITEMWFETREDYEALYRRLHEGEVQKLLLEEQKKVFGDLDPPILVVSEECETDFG